MKTIDIDRLRRDEAAITQRFQSGQPFKYVLIDDFLRPDIARAIYDEFPHIDQSWIDSNGLHTRGKWAKRVFSGMAADFYREVNSPEFVGVLERITGIRNILEDRGLEGAGYHQVINGGFLNVHVDFNKHQGLDRRLNLIVYLNPYWREKYGGYLELWDMQRQARIENIAPSMNRCVIFETNEVSYHGHPVPLSVDGERTRRSLSVYYYTQGRDDITAAPEHNTLYRNTLGAGGAVRVFFNGVVHAGRKLLRAIRS